MCIERTNRDVIIVSRDADYGLTLKGKGYANTWLSEEVKERINQQRKLILVDRLSSALKLFAVKVTPEEIRSERTTIAAAANDLQVEMEDLIDEHVHEIVDSEKLCDLIANTNAFGWGLDTHNVSNGRFENGKYTADVEFSVCGQQDDNKPWHGTTISGQCIVTVDKDKSVTFSRIEAYLEEDSDDHNEENGVVEIPT